MYRLHTNEGEFLVMQKPTTDQMIRYIRAKQAIGYRLSEVVFCHGPVHVIHNAKSLVDAAEAKCQAHCPLCKRALLNGKCNQTTGNCIEEDKANKVAPKQWGEQQ